MKERLADAKSIVFVNFKALSAAETKRFAGTCLEIRWDTL